MNKDKNIKKEGEIDLREIFMIFIRRKWWFIGSVLIILIIGFLYVFLKPVNYLLTYQIEVKENYSNKYLSELYQGYEKDLNYITLTNVPVIFKSAQVFESIKSIGGEIDYNDLLKSDCVSISLNKDTSIFNINVSNPDYNLADEIAKTLIDAFDNFIKNKEEIILNEFLEKIEIDIEYFDTENDNNENAMVVNLEKELESLYQKLYRYIVDYNVGLFNELEERKNSENISFYNIIIPPNNINNEISILKKEIDLNIQSILDKKNKITNLYNLKESLLKDKDIILNRVNLTSESPSYKIEESNRLRNIAVILVLSIVIGITFTFFINFLISSKKNK